MSLPPIFKNDPDSRKAARVFFVLARRKQSYEKQTEAIGENW